MGIRFYEPGDEEQINQLFQKVFNKERTLEHWDWKFKQKPLSDNPWVLVFEEDQQILGHISLWISEVYINGRVEKAGLRADTMVDPSARGKGIYKSLNEAMISYAKEAGIAYLYGFPAPKAKQLLLAHTNAVNLGGISRYIYVLNPVALLAGKTKLAKPMTFADGFYNKLRAQKEPRILHEGLAIEQVTELDPGFTELAKKTAAFKPFILKRNAEYMNWRYVNHPDNQYTILAVKIEEQLQGYIVIKKEEKTFKHGSVISASIIDWLGTSTVPTWHILLQEAVDFLRDDVDIIQTWCMKGNEAEVALKKFGFMEKDKPSELVVHPLEDGAAIQEDIVDWWVVQGDIDSF
ncbi:GNAT family N-acetyltransferase [Sediminibacillus massiliensis]|uniref:GNAT family N-acetyltransferase n=1 Tax=Sediminibacillus massiliensis TaxID=1926277 RepID=UPI0009887C0E|nr:GNAT family N-acetyltransferase [Sediminibacillus massiliensis]